MGLETLTRGSFEVTDQFCSDKEPVFGYAILRKKVGRGIGCQVKKVTGKVIMSE